MGAWELDAWHVTEELGECVALMLAIGATAFIVLLLPGLRRRLPEAPASLFDAMQVRAAWLGAFGAAYLAWALGSGLPAAAARRGLTVTAFLASQPAALAGVIAILAILLGLAVATRRWPVGPGLAAAGVLVHAFRALLSGAPERLLKPVHTLAAGLWIGTLAMLVLAGLALVRERRVADGSRVAAMLLHAFTPWALGSAALLAVLGAALTLREVGPPGPAWGSPYALVLLVKLALVAVVAGFGAWNWRRVGPALDRGADPGLLTRSASGELAVAFLVLVATAVLASLEAPR